MLRTEVIMQKAATITARDKAPEKQSNDSIYHPSFPRRLQVSFRNFIFCEKKVNLKHLSVIDQPRFLFHPLPAAKKNGMTGRG